MRITALARLARPEDLDAVTGLCLAARGESTVGAQLCTDDADRLRHQAGALANEQGAVLLVGELDGAVQGLLLARVVEPSLFCDEVSVVIEALYVAEEARRRGIGHALLGGIADEAERVGAGEVYVMPLPGARGMMRFLLRLGFGPAASHRVVSVESLQRRLSTERPIRRRTASRSIDDLVARRRLARTSRAASRVDALAVPPHTGTTTGGLPPVGQSPPGVAAQSPRTSISMQVSRAVQIRRPPGSSTTTS